MSGSPDRVDAYEVFATPDVAPDQLAERIRERLSGTSWRADTGADKENDGSIDPFVQQASNVTVLMAMTSVVTGFVSIFVVASTFACRCRCRSRE